MWTEPLPSGVWADRLRGQDDLIVAGIGVFASLSDDGRDLDRAQGWPNVPGPEVVADPHSAPGLEDLGGRLVMTTEPSDDAVPIRPHADDRAPTDLFDPAVRGESTGAERGSPPVIRFQRPWSDSNKTFQPRLGEAQSQTRRCRCRAVRSRALRLHHVHREGSRSPFPTPTPEPTPSPHPHVPTVLPTPETNRGARGRGRRRPGCPERGTRQFAVVPPSGGDELVPILAATDPAARRARRTSGR
ncbi:hypothetical protein GQR58_030164 [Nymphon striatum]|nr:hypothetical protein GQR58_030164 [Nymphon striatum]